MESKRISSDGKVGGAFGGTTNLNRNNFPRVFPSTAPKFTSSVFIITIGDYKVITPYR